MYQVVPQGNPIEYQFYHPVFTFLPPLVDIDIDSFHFDSSAQEVAPLPDFQTSIFSQTGNDGVLYDVPSGVSGTCIYQETLFGDCEETYTLTVDLNSSPYEFTYEADFEDVPDCLGVVDQRWTGVLQ